MERASGVLEFGPRTLPSFLTSLRFSRSLSVMRPFFKAHPFFGQTERASATRFPFLPCGHERRPRPPRRRRRRHSRFSSRRRRRNRLCIPDGIRAARGSLKEDLLGGRFQHYTRMPSDGVCRLKYSRLENTNPVCAASCSDSVSKLDHNSFAFHSLTVCMSLCSALHAARTFLQCSRGYGDSFGYTLVDLSLASLCIRLSVCFLIKSQFSTGVSQSCICALAIL